MKTITVTPLLDVGGGDDTPEVAVARVLSHQRANVPSLDDARSVLRTLGLREELVEDRIHFALTGKVLVEG
ncbi:MAG: hypothetical protein ABR616_15815 [Dermatophilaceae bacterium]